jgi:hypothetical protein
MPKPKGEASNVPRLRCPHTDTEGSYSISPLPPRLQLTQAFQSSRSKRSRVCSVVGSRLNTHVFLLSQSAPITSMLREVSRLPIHCPKPSNSLWPRFAQLRPFRRHNVGKAETRDCSDPYCHCIMAQQRGMIDCLLLGATQRAHNIHYESCMYVLLRNHIFLVYTNYLFRQQIGVIIYV